MVPAQEARSTGPLSGEELYKTACALLDSGDASSAIEALSQAVARRPDVPAYALKLADAYATAGRPAEAQSLLDLLGKKFPNDDSVCLARARAFHAIRKFDRARELLDPRSDRLRPDGVLLRLRCVRETSGPMEADRLSKLAVAKFPQDAPLRIEFIESALRLRQSTTALKRIEEARRVLRGDPMLDLLAAEALFELGKYLGATQVRKVPGGQVGQFRDEGLLIELRAAPDRFLCCPPDSSLYAVRRALDAGVDLPRAHLLHARIWRKANRPEIGFAVLKSRETLLLEGAGDEVLDVFSDLSLAAGQLVDYLWYAQRRAELHPERRAEILSQAYLAVAETYNQRGTRSFCGGRCVRRTASRS
jgi:tetratricopeptide (TPR) repeat protein